MSSSSAAIPEKEDEVITEQIGVTRENLDDQQQPRQQPLQQRSWMDALANMSATKMIYIISFIMVAVVVVVLCGMLISDLFNSVKRNAINYDTNSNLLRGNKLGWNGMYHEVTIHFTCGNENKIINIKEQFERVYVMLFETPFICIKHNPEDKHKPDEL
ncbi:unnamed protein product [Adineta steineri]|uniref:Uncharacterized protein n=1 Tax=Adineta steineri TaxID=433720 RepID=A0A814WNB9_9BILA|nr:unnamed protein product [Adineta steineri]